MLSLMDEALDAVNREERSLCPTWFRHLVPTYATDLNE